MILPQTNTHTYGNVEIVIHRPVLDEQTRQKNEANLLRALACCGRSMHRRENQNEDEGLVTA